MESTFNGECRDGAESEVFFAGSKNYEAFLQSELKLSNVLKITFRATFPVQIRFSFRTEEKRKLTLIPLENDLKTDIFIYFCLFRH